MICLHDSRSKSSNQIQILSVQIPHPGSVECELSNREEEGVPLRGCLNADCRKQSRLLIIKLGTRIQRLCEYTELSCVGGYNMSWRPSSDILFNAAVVQYTKALLCPSLSLAFCMSGELRGCLGLGRCRQAADALNTYIHTGRQNELFLRLRLTCSVTLGDWAMNWNLRISIITSNN